MADHRNVVVRRDHRDSLRWTPDCSFTPTDIHRVRSHKSPSSCVPPRAARFPVLARRVCCTNRDSCPPISAAASTSARQHSGTRSPMRTPADPYRSGEPTSTRAPVVRLLQPDRNDSLPPVRPLAGEAAWSRARPDQPHFTPVDPWATVKAQGSQVDSHRLRAVEGRVVAQGPLGRSSRGGRPMTSRAMASHAGGRSPHIVGPQQYARGCLSPSAWSYGR